MTREKKEKASDYPYKYIRVIARQLGVDRLHNIKMIYPNVYSGDEYKTNRRLVIDMKQKICFLWNNDEQKVIPKKNAGSILSTHCII